MQNIKKTLQALSDAKLVLTSFLIVLLCFMYFTNRYVIAFNGANSDCLNARLFLVDRWDKTYSPGHIIAFTMNVETELFGIGDGWIKMVAATGEPGKEVDVRVEEYSVHSDGNSYRISLGYLLGALGMEFSQIKRHWQLKEDEIFMVGETITSYDSRIWGPINKADVIGRAYAIL